MLQNYDALLTIGVILGVFSIPSILSALSDNRSPRVGALVLIASGALVAYAVTQKPSGYTLDQIPDVLVKTIMDFVT